MAIPCIGPEEGAPIPIGARVFCERCYRILYVVQHILTTFSPIIASYFRSAYPNVPALKEGDPFVCPFCGEPLQDRNGQLVYLPPLECEVEMWTTT